jgi:hypothetical protein
MSKLYGSLQGCRGEATRCGSKNSGMRASVQSWNGSLISYMDLDDNDKPIITLKTSDGSSCIGFETIFRGSLEELKAKLKA